MSSRELVVLGTASQVPTRERNHNACFLRWDETGILFDPGEGTQRQMIHAGLSVSSIRHVCITHFHGDHCLGLPGILQRLSLDGVEHAVDVHYPAEGEQYAQRLRYAVAYDERASVSFHGVDGEGIVIGPEPFTLSARRLDHRIPTIGWRLEEPPGRHMLPERLEALGVEGPDVGRLLEAGELTVDGRRVELDEVSEPRRGQVFAFVMDTRVCDAAVELARDADLLVCESTFSDDQADLARRYHHLTARQAAWIAAEAGARRLVLTHFSQRQPDESVLSTEAREVFDDVVAARDLTRVEVPGRP